MGRRPGEPPFLQGKVGYRIAPSSDPASPAHLPPKGKALGVGETTSLETMRRRLPALARAGTKSNLFFARTRAGQKTLLTPRVPASLARFGVHPPILGAQRSGSQNSCPLPARPAGGRAVTGVRYRAAGQAEKKREPPQGPPNQSRESRGENLSPLALFPPVSREKRGPRRVGALRGAAPRGLVRAPTTRRVRSTAPPKKINLQTSIFNSIIKSR